MSVPLSFIAGVRLDTSGSAAARIVGPGDDFVIGDISSGVVEAVKRLAAGRSTYEALIGCALASAGMDGLRALHECFEQLFARCWLEHRVCYRGVPIASAIPFTSDYDLRVEPADDRACVLSRFGFLRRDGTRIVLESPTAHAQVVLHDWRAMVLLWRMASLRGTVSAEAPKTRLPSKVLQSLIDLLWTAGFLTTIHPDGIPEDETSPLLHWEFHDLLFHSRSRLGRHRSPYGATYRLEGRVATPPAIKPRPAGERISLARPDIAHLIQIDWPLTRALEGRRSQREHGDVAITKRQLGEFLYRTASVRSVNQEGRYATSRRVYPSGGAAYALEVYVAVKRCEHLGTGLYHYCPKRHDLQQVARMNSDVEALLSDAARAAHNALPQVLVTITARFVRASWKYSSISYALILKDVGALLQTMCLVATAMDLAVCAIGGGNSDLFAKAAGNDYYDEGSVGELILGRPAAIRR